MGSIQRTPKNHPTFLRTQAKLSAFVDSDFWIKSFTIKTIKTFIHSQIHKLVYLNKQVQKEDTDVDSFIYSIR